MPEQSATTSVDDGEIDGFRSGVTRIGSGVVAGRIVLFWYSKGAAHPNQSLGTVVIANRTATPVTVNDLYQDHAAALTRLHVDAVFTARDGTRKLRLRTTDGHAIESVLIPNEGRGLTQCVSSMVGCSLTCRFCATATLGFQRNLSSWEIVDQVYLGRRLLAEVDRVLPDEDTIRLRQDRYGQAVEAHAAALARVQVEDVSDEGLIPLVDDAAPKLSPTGQWRTELSPAEWKDPRITWLATVSNTLRVYRSTTRPLVLMNTTDGPAVSNSSIVLRSLSARSPRASCPSRR